MRLPDRGNRSIAMLGFACVAACAGGSTAAAAPVPGAQSSRADTTGIIPAGFGSLRQSEISVSVSANGLNVQAMPLADDFIRTLAPDSYAGVMRIRESKRATLDTIARRAGQTSLSLWYFTFRNVQPGEAPFSPRDVVITNQGRDFKPIDVVGITPGFGDNRVRQNETHVGILVFEGGINVNQPLTIVIGSQKSTTNWQSVIQMVEGERARVRARAGAKGAQEPRPW